MGKNDEENASKQAEKELQEDRIRQSNTTEEALKYLGDWGYQDMVMQEALARIQRQMNLWGKGKVDVEVVTFSTVYGILGDSRCYTIDKNFKYDIM
jgi:cobalamin biosynthesis protein CbiD